LRQAPDVILIGEIRDAETMEHALAFAETGHLAISTLHANNANQALDRIINFFSSDRHAQILQDMGLNMQAIVSQRLVPTVDNKRVAAVEVLLGTKTIQDLIYKGDIDSIKEIMTKSETLGMQTFDAALFKLHQGGKVSLEEVLKNADSANNLRLRIKLAEGGSPVGSVQEAKPSDFSAQEASAFAGLSLEKTEEEKRADEKQTIDNADPEYFQAARKKVRG
jgi:twitching motility protein PilU